MRPRRASAVRLLGACLLSLSALRRAGAHEPDRSKYAYWKDVYPILTARCGDCHMSDGVAPMNLLDYEEASPWAASIKIEVLEGRMPPWPPEEGWGEHQGARGLTAQEIDILVDWAGGGAPEGERVDAPEAPMAAEPGWALGEPDLVIEPPSETRLGGEQLEETSCWVAPIGNPQPRWLSAIDFQPGHAGIVRGARVDLAPACPTNGARPPLLAWVPGQKPLRLPRGAGELIPAGGRLAVTIRYRKSWRDDGKEVRDRSRIGLYFSRSAPRRLGSFKFDGPVQRVDREMEILSVWPAEARPIELEAALPDGKVVRLLRIGSAQPEWVARYFFLEPILLPAGSELRVSRPGVWIEHLEPGTRQRH